MKKPESIDEYLASFPTEARAKMERLRALIHEEAPACKEVISYGMPGFRGNKLLVWFAGWKSHIGFYPGGTVQDFAAELGDLAWSKGAIQFPMDKSLPEELIRRIVRRKVEIDNAVVKEKKVKA